MYKQNIVVHLKLLKYHKFFAFIFVIVVVVIDLLTDLRQLLVQWFVHRLGNLICVSVGVSTTRENKHGIIQFLRLLR